MGETLIGIPQQEAQRAMPPIQLAPENEMQPEAPKANESTLKRLVRNLMKPLSILRGK